MRPTYKVMYKMVTAREWRCCPGHSGPSCEEGRTALGRARCLPAGAREEPEAVVQTVGAEGRSTMRTGGSYAELPARRTATEGVCCPTGVDGTLSGPLEEFPA